jgi:hypothetical protein
MSRIVVARPQWEVFISHTSELASFPAGRSFVAAARDGVRGAGHIAVEMADFPAAEEPPAELCRAKVAGSDVVSGPGHAT